jgi:hypothetical protein
MGFIFFDDASKMSCGIIGIPAYATPLRLHVHLRWLVIATRDENDQDKSCFVLHHFLYLTRLKNHIFGQIQNP